MTTTRRTLAAACATVLFAVPALAEDLTLVFKSTGQGGAGTSTSYYSSEKMRVGDAERDTIVEYGPAKIVTIDHKKKEYSEITLAEMEQALKAAAAKMEQASAQMKEQMASMPPAVREKMEQMMGGGGSSLVTVTKGGTRQVAGYSCQDYTIAMGQLMTSKVCATTALQFPAPNVDHRRYASLAGSASAMANNPMVQNMEKLTEEMKKIEGFTIAESSSMKMMGKSFDSSKEAVEIRKGPIPASAFDVAAIAKGYKKVAHPVTQLK